MRHVRVRYLATFLAFTATATVIAGCGEENGITEPPPALVGTWNATSIMAAGVDLFAQGMNVSFTFTADGEYSFVVSGDLLGFCDPGPTCSDFGDFTATASSVTFDPGTVDELTLTYTISGNTLSASGVFDGVSVSITFEKS